MNKILTTYCVTMLAAAKLFAGPIIGSGSSVDTNALAVGILSTANAYTDAATNSVLSAAKAYADSVTNAIASKTTVITFTTNVNSVTFNIPTARVVRIVAVLTGSTNNISYTEVSSLFNGDSAGTSYKWIGGRHETWLSNPQVNSGTSGYLPWTLNNGDTLISSNGMTVLDMTLFPRNAPGANIGPARCKFEVIGSRSSSDGTASYYAGSAVYIPSVSVSNSTIFTSTSIAWGTQSIIYVTPYPIP